MAGEWITKRIGELGKVITGKTPSTKVPEYFGGEYPFITIPDLDGRRDITTTARSLSQRGAEELRRCQLPAGAVMMSCIATIGKCGMTVRPSFTNQQINSVVCGSDVSAKYLYYVFTTLAPALEAAGGGGSVYTNVSKSRFEDIIINLPPLKEQQAIACILGALDDKIELNRRMNQTLEEMARAIFKSWFVDFDPVRAKAAIRREHPTWTDEQVSRAACPKLKPEIAALFPDAFEDSELGEIPKGWGVKSFTNDIDVIGGGTPKTSNSAYWGGNIPWFSVADTPATGEVFVISTEKTITQEGLNNSSTRILPFGTTIISARGTVGNLALVGVPMAMNQSCYGLHDRRRSHGYFLYFATATVVETLRQRTHGSVFNTITRDTLNSIYVAVPPDALVSAFERVTEGLLLRVLSALQESRTLAALRDTLLPKLISGELRVPDAERIAGRCV